MAGIIKGLSQNFTFLRGVFYFCLILFRPVTNNEPYRSIIKTEYVHQPER
jgi:hypothetical protein